ncbi:MAG: hypothetical protein COT18_07970 [Elusimicrobia bacterium CG08_land_8_20_14_0_20_59_10]|nr:MAG: hypothetical protein COT18_07970 [Elusimicrobia bacterium CG08_land_8_20_14_0_20_59_10]
MRCWPGHKPVFRGAPAAFLDRDGTLNRNRHGQYITRPGQLRLYARASAALKLLARKGYLLVVITNQSGIGRGYMTMAVSKAINLKLVGELRRKGVRLDAVYFCPHVPGDNCSCRKPAPGLAQEAAADGSLDLERSFVAGDKASDLEFAVRAGLKGHLVLTGAGRKTAARLKKKAFRDILSLAKAMPEIKA